LMTYLISSSALPEASNDPPMATDFKQEI
jgi:hypothetical protein